jgi:hypothetical protein
MIQNLNVPTDTVACGPQEWNGNVCEDGRWEAQLDYGQVQQSNLLNDTLLDCQGNIVS